MKFIQNTDRKIVLFLVISFILLRSIHFSDYLNFSADQGIFSLKALELWNNREFTLVGPPTSFIYEGRAIFQGSIIYYTQLLFLQLGQFNPIAASYIFMLFCALMVIPLYVGSKLLFNRKTAILVTALYTGLPFYVEYTRFLWNPTFQLSLTPFLILSLGLWKAKKQMRFLFWAGFVAGILILYHYQFVIVISLLVLFFSYLSIKQKTIQPIALFLVGTILGSFPFWLFELKNNFYNLNTAFYLFQNRELLIQDRSSLFTPHYFLSITLFFLVLISFYVTKYINQKILFAGTVILFVYSFLIYIQKPTHGYGMVQNWNYPLEQKAYQIIREQNLPNYNVVNIGYETIASVQKYLHAKDGAYFEFNNYYTNQYLFIITNKDNFLNDPSYEISSFQTPKIINTWDLNEKFKLVLIERIQSEDSDSAVN